MLHCCIGTIPALPLIVLTKSLSTVDTCRSDFGIWTQVFRTTQLLSRHLRQWHKKAVSCKTTPLPKINSFMGGSTALVTPSLKFRPLAGCGHGCSQCRCFNLLKMEIFTFKIARQLIPNCLISSEWEIKCARMFQIKFCSYVCSTFDFFMISAVPSCKAGFWAELLPR